MCADERRCENNDRRLSGGRESPLSLMRVDLRSPRCRLAQGGGSAERVRGLRLRMSMRTAIPRMIHPPAWV